MPKKRKRKRKHKLRQEYQDYYEYYESRPRKKRDRDWIDDFEEGWSYGSDAAKSMEPLIDLGIEIFRLFW